MPTLDAPNALRRVGLAGAESKADPPCAAIAQVVPRWSAALLALGATTTTQGAGGSEQRSVEALLEVKKAVNITRLHVPITGLSWGEAHVGRTPADEPIVAAVAAVETTDGIVSQARVALTGVWSKPVSLAVAPANLIGSPLTQAQILSSGHRSRGRGRTRR